MCNADLVADAGMFADSAFGDQDKCSSVVDCHWCQLRANDEPLPNVVRLAEPVRRTQETRDGATMS